MSQLKMFRAAGVAVADRAWPASPAILRKAPVRYRSALKSRMRTVVECLHTESASADDAALYSQLCSVLEAGAQRSAHWLAISVILASLPTSNSLATFARACELDGADSALADLLERTFDAEQEPSPNLLSPVEIVRNGVCVDVWLTSKADVATGIQRVVRELTRRWDDSRSITLVGWTDDQTALRLLTETEHLRALTGSTGRAAAAESATLDSALTGLPLPTIVVPWGGVLVEPELVGDPPRALRLMGLAQHSNVELSVIAYDTVPVSSAETANDGVSGSFAKYLSALKHSTRLAADSQSAAGEFVGFRRMLRAQGLPGPDIIGLPLAIDAPPSDAAAEAAVRELLGAFSLPLVLCVGSHEPRKNHLAVLHAAELAWRRGHRFILAFVGGSGWHSEHFDAGVLRLRAANRPISTVRALPDAQLWAAYRVARCVLFPSLHEGFGLPIAEAIASGVPVITSNFGSMREVAQHGGALLIDPRDDHALRDAIESLLTDDALHALLREQAAAVPVRTWDDYADEAWAYLVEGQNPASAG